MFTQQRDSLPRDSAGKWHVSSFGWSGAVPQDAHRRLLRPFCHNSESVDVLQPVNNRLGFSSQLDAKVGLHVGIFESSYE